MTSHEVESEEEYDWAGLLWARVNIPWAVPGTSVEHWLEEAESFGLNLDPEEVAEDLERYQDDLEEQGW